MSRYGEFRLSPDPDGVYRGNLHGCDAAVAAMHSKIEPYTLRMPSEREVSEVREGLSELARKTFDRLLTEGGTWANYNVHALLMRVCKLVADGETELGVLDQQLTDIWVTGGWCLPGRIDRLVQIIFITKFT